MFWFLDVPPTDLSNCLFPLSLLILPAKASGATAGTQVRGFLQIPECVRPRADGCVYPVRHTYQCLWGSEPTRHPPREFAFSAQWPRLSSVGQATLRSQPGRRQSLGVAVDADLVLRVGAAHLIPNKPDHNSHSSVRGSPSHCEASRLQTHFTENDASIKLVPTR